MRSFEGEEGWVTMGSHWIRGWRGQDRQKKDRIIFNAPLPSRGTGEGRVSQSMTNYDREGVGV